MKRIGVVGTCQASGIGNAAFHLFDEPEVSSFVIGDIHRAKRLAEAESVLAECDLVFSHYLPDDMGAFSTASLEKRVRRLILVPPVVFTGFHPDCVEFRWQGSLFRKPLGGYHSAIIAAAYSLDVPIERVPHLFNHLVFGKLGYYDEFAKARAFLDHTMRSYGIDIAEEWPAWMASGAFMHTYNHPKSLVLASVLKLLAVKAGLVPEGTPTPAMSIDPLVLFPVWPVYPEIAQALGLPGSYVFKEEGLPDVTAGSHNLLRLKDFIRISYESYADIPAEAFSVEALAPARRVLSSVLVS